MNVDLSDIELETFISRLSPAQKNAIRRSLASLLRSQRKGAEPTPYKPLPISDAARCRISSMWNKALLELEQAQVGLDTAVERLQTALDRAISVKPLGEKLPSVRKHFLLYQCRDCGKEKK